MFCGGCCKREQAVTLELPDPPATSEPGANGIAPLAVEHAEATDPFLGAPVKGAEISMDHRAAGIEQPADKSAPAPPPSPPAAAATEAKVVVAKSPPPTAASPAVPVSSSAAPVPKLSDNDEKEEPAGFTLVLDRSDPSQPLGALFDASMPSELYVSAVLNGVDGLVQHAERSSTSRLQAGDFIVAVNGIGGSEMPKELQNAKRLELSVKRPREFEITIIKHGSLGCSITYDANTGVALGVASVLDGPIEVWNNQARSKNDLSRVVQEGDRIIAVNGKRGYTSQLLEAIHSTTELRVTLARACR